MRPLLATVALLFLAITATPARAAFDPSLLVPQPQRLSAGGCTRAFARAMRLPAGFDFGARELLDERWRALGIPTTQIGTPADVVVRPAARGEREGYTLMVNATSVNIAAADPEGVFDAAMTLAQLAQPSRGGFTLPCVRIDDAPALRWRIVSDDVSRGPLPAMRYFKERIRGLAALKINGYSIYMEHVFADARHPIVAPAGAITPHQLRELRDYAARFHMTFIPEQQTLAHMHGTLRWEEFGALSSPPHGWLLSPSDAKTYRYLAPLLREEATAAGKISFFHLGSDEPVDLQGGDVPRLFAQHVQRVEAIVRPFGARPMIWDDAVQAHHEILQTIPRDTVIVDFHYGRERTFLPYIRPIAAAGFAQMVAPGASNWNEIYPRIDVAFDNIAPFVAEGRASHVLGMFMTVWHDDGESLYEATWYPLAFAAANAWQSQDVDRSRFARAFAWAFFGSTDPRWTLALERLRAIGDRLQSDDDPSDYLFWADPFDAAIGDRVRRNIDLVRLRLNAESVLNDVRVSPPLHANAARVMGLAARRFDALGRRYQIGIEAKAHYEDARAGAGAIERDLNLAKYLCWELRDDILAIEPQYRAAWQYESRPAGLGAVLVRYHLAEQRAAADADRLNVAEREDYYRKKGLPAFESAIGRAP